MGDAREIPLNDLVRMIPGYDPFRDAGECVLDPETAMRALDFFPTFLTHIEGDLAGKPLVLEPWQGAIIANLFGWLKPDGTRRYQTAFIFVPRKNGKTVLASGIVCYTMFCDGEPGAQVYSAAAEREQAALVFRHAAGMVQQNKMLADRAKIYRTFKSIEYPELGCVYRALSADAGTKHGFNTHCAVVDELHAHPTRDLVDVLQSSTGARKQPLIVHITTSDFERPSICNELHGYASRVRDGIVRDARFLPVIYEALQTDDWLDESTWAKANPNLGVSLSRDWLRAEAQYASDSPAYLNTFLRLHLNIRTQADVAWWDMASWDKCARLNPGESPMLWRARLLELLEGEDCWIGLDLASTADVVAAVQVFPDVDDLGLVTIPHFWIPADNAVKREKRDRVPYTTWAREGFLELTPGNVCDYARVRRRLQELGKAFRVREILYDRWNASHLVTQLQDEDGFTMTGFGQGFASMSAPSKELEALVRGGGMAHGGNPVLRWMASNVMVEQDAAGNIKPSKKRSREKIDGIVALVEALGGVIVRKGDGGSSVYSSRGVIRL